MLFNVKGMRAMEYEMQGIGSSKHEYATKLCLFYFFFNLDIRSLKDLSVFTFSNQ